MEYPALPLADFAISGLGSEKSKQSDIRKSLKYGAYSDIIYS
jgi:hypothetical protein